MTLIALIIHAFLSSTAMSDSDRMSAQMNSPTITLVSAGQTQASENPAETYSRLIPCDPDNCGKATQ